MGRRLSQRPWYGSAVELDPDRILRELQQIATRLEDLPQDSPERLELEQRRRGLHLSARRAADAARNQDNLRAELEHLRNRLKTFEADKVEVPGWQIAMTHGGRFSLTNPVADAARINDAMDQGTALDRFSIEARIAALEKALGE